MKERGCARIGCGEPMEERKVVGPKRKGRGEIIRHFMRRFII